jgi:hypothetical protein
MIALSIVAELWLIQGPGCWSLPLARCVWKSAWALHCPRDSEH